MNERIRKICDRYEDGFGWGYNHGCRESGERADPELAEAFQIGYEAGFKAREAQIKRLRVAQGVRNELA